MISIIILTPIVIVFILALIPSKEKEVTVSRTPDFSEELKKRKLKALKNFDKGMKFTTNPKHKVHSHLMQTKPNMDDAFFDSFYLGK